MGILIPTVIKALQAIGPITAALPEFKALYDQIVGTFKEDDQTTLKKAYDELLAENTGGHVRLQEILRRSEATATDLRGNPIGGR